MLLLTVFTSGAVLMAVEMIGSRMLAPYFGSSLFVWGALIAVVLTALSIGYWAGGYWADRRPEPGPLSAILLAAGAWTWLLPSLAGSLLPRITAAMPDPRSGALLASLGLFAGPALLMAMVSPWAVRLAAREMGRIGSTAGLLYAVSTAGSIAGTLVTSFYLIPAFGTADLTRGLGLVLTVTGGLYAGRFGARAQARAAAGLTLALLVMAWLLPPGSPLVALPGDVPDTAAGVGGGVAGSQAGGDGSGAAYGGAAGSAGSNPIGGDAGSTGGAGGGAAGAPSRGTGGTGSGSGGGEERPPGSGDPAGRAAPDDRDQAVGTVAGPFTDGLVHETESLYHYIRVENRGGFRYLRFDNSWQSGMDLDDPVATVFTYTDYLLLPFAQEPEARHGLLVGLGGGSVVKKLLAARAGLRLDVAELDPAVVDVAHTYFGVPSGHPRLKITAADGRRFLADAGTDTAYDVIMLDAYYADSLPFHLTTGEFLTLVRSRLTAGGLVAANLIGALEGPRSTLLRAMVRTFEEVFPEIYVFPVDDRSPEDYQNVILVAPREARGWTRRDWVAAAEAAAGGLLTPALADYAADLYEEALPTDDVPLLTDDHAPVDNLLHLYE